MVISSEWPCPDSSLGLDTLSRLTFSLKGKVSEILMEQEPLRGRTEEKENTHSLSLQFSTALEWLHLWKNRTEHPIFRSQRHLNSYLSGRQTFNFFVHLKVIQAQRKSKLPFNSKPPDLLLIPWSWDFGASEVMPMFQAYLRNKVSTNVGNAVSKL